MASTSIKPTAGSSSKQSSRNNGSASRVAATKSSKAQKVSTPAPKAKSSAPPAVSKKLSAVPPPPAVPAEARTPQNAKSELKAQFARLSAATSQITGLKRTLNKSFYDVGTLLNQIRNEKLYEVKGYGSFESFVERELDLNKVLCMRAARIAEAIHRDQALAAGLERAAAAVAALDGELEPATPTRPAGSPAGGIPVHKQ
jgi:hypothetical protein